MFRLLLALSLITCLPTPGKEEVGATAQKEVKAFQVPFALKKVHPENDAKLRAIEAGEPVPTGYAIFQMTTFDDEGKKDGMTPILLSQENIVEKNSVAFAHKIGGAEEISVSLTQQGGEKLTKATQELRLGRDRMAIVFEDRCLIAPTVQAVLSKNFVVSGLSNPAEEERLLKSLAGKAPK